MSLIFLFGSYIKSPLVWNRASDLELWVMKGYLGVLKWFIGLGDEALKGKNWGLSCLFWKNPSSFPPFSFPTGRERMSLEGEARASFGPHQVGTGSLSSGLEPKRSSTSFPGTEVGKDSSSASNPTLLVQTEKKTIGSNPRPTCLEVVAETWCGVLLSTQYRDRAEFIVMSPWRAGWRSPLSYPLIASSSTLTLFHWRKKVSLPGSSAFLVHHPPLPPLYQWDTYLIENFHKLNLEG